jgi:hypothetical protein
MSMLRNGIKNSLTPFREKGENFSPFSSLLVYFVEALPLPPQTCPHDKLFSR